MKKFFISIATVLCVAAVSSAQTLIVVEEKPLLTNRRGVPILPQAGDMSIGISMTPFFDYLGNMFTRNGINTAPTFASIGTGINMKWLTTDRQALRLGVTINFGNDYYYGNPLANGSSSMTVTDEMKHTVQQFGLNIGYEWRKGVGRVQGFYGVQLVAAYSNYKTRFDYGNAMNGDYPSPWIWDFNADAQVQASSRTIEVKGAPVFSIGLNGFIGAEYFFAPKMSVGGEFGLGLVYVNQSESEYRNQYFDAATGSAAESTVKRHDSQVPTDGFNIRTVPQGNIFLSFYF